MPHLSASEIRQQFLDFFREKAHEIVPSAPLVPQQDPTLLFTNAGMNQFKDVFLGEGDRPYVRAADTQKCLRVSGKHNDLEEVGHDTYHHTFFEMLGNWSFGDYFKREAIRWAWELLVDQWGLPADRLYATVHEGDTGFGLNADHEAVDLWKAETGIDPAHILMGDSKDNFWTMGDTGPCGPCSEIHVDLRSDEERQQTPGHELVNADHPQVMEIWNLVFIQYNLHADGSLEPLKAKHVDTGMGFERLCAVLQGKTSNYDTDLFGPLLQKIADLSPNAAIKGYDDVQADDDEREKIRIAMRVVADHARTIAFAIADGAQPGNVGRGYVIRRILRRAVRYGYQSLGFRAPFLYRLVPTLVEEMGGTFGELGERQAYIEKITKAEEESFLQTLESGLAFFDRTAAYAQGDQTDLRDRLADDRQTRDLLQKAYDGDATNAFVASVTAGRIPGEVAFLLHDTYGFPVDLTQLMAREQGLAVDVPRFNELMKAQRERARAASSFKSDAASGDWQIISDGDDSAFTGYDDLTAEGARIRAVRTVGEGDDAQHQLVLDATPFYAESGGQIGDTGVLRVGEETVRVLDTKKIEGRIVHIVEALPLDLDAPVAAGVDAQRRQQIMRHHSATHLLHAALRDVLGPHVQQKGSLVAPDRLRFDFSHYEKLTPEEVARVEAQVNEKIQANIARQEDRDVPIADAQARGATALFGEKYGDAVRVITFDPEYSIELCGGTHVDATGELGLFRLVSEGSVASGVRRVEAVTGPAALTYVRQELDELNAVRGLFKSLQRPVVDEVADLLEQKKTLEKDVARLQQEAAAGGLDRLITDAQAVPGPNGTTIRLVTGRIPGADMNTLRSLGEDLRDRLGDGAVAVLGSADEAEGKAYLVATVSDDLIKQGVQAGKLVGTLAREIGGGGGGRPTLATAGGKQPEKLDAALARTADVLAG